MGASPYVKGALSSVITSYLYQGLWDFCLVSKHESRSLIDRRMRRLLAKPSMQQKRFILLKYIKAGNASYHAISVGRSSRQIPIWRHNWAAFESIY